ncbi:MAG: tRNA uridine-5-carboxymethylaminomethyl(34) synthesis GTPase MnmE [Alphaproteobacteria bacterium]|nr:tRNA uridine-5-carboxymethylaminomethyl(34) synthesis GTPase MnmE [Alphaproteobacteria bacterium]
MKTIYALATPPGRGALAIIRVSGPMAPASLRDIVGVEYPPPRIPVVRPIRDPESGAVIDTALIIFFPAPSSFTGEDVVEYHVHGGVAVVRSLLDALSRRDGHRLAEPGEFTRRAFENGKMDLTEAEAIADLIDAETELQRRQAVGQLCGDLRALYSGWAEELSRCLAHLEADIDFPDEDLPGGVVTRVEPVLRGLIADISGHLDDNRRGERLRGGIHVAVVGAPNAGKSSLANALARREAAIVSEIAGTTRDVIEVHLDLGGYPVILADTAGLRPDQLGTEGHDMIESEGIRRALARAQEADIRLLLFDASALPAVDPHTLALMDESALPVLNKIDSGTDSVPSELAGAIAISVKTGEGLPALVDAIVARAANLVGTRETPSLTRRRHRESLERCRDALRRAIDAHLPELVAEDVRLAVRELGRITGRVDIEDLLDVIFRDFCIGK